MGVAKGHRVVLSVAYKIDYCIKKAEQHINHCDDVTFIHINKVKVGELEECDKFYLSE